MAATTDGYTISTVEQEGEYAGQTMGRVWLQTPGTSTWTWYGCADVAEAEALAASATTMTAAEFDAYWEALPA